MAYEQTRVTDRDGVVVGEFGVMQWTCYRDCIDGIKRKVVVPQIGNYTPFEARAFALAILRAADECEAHEFTEVQDAGNTDVAA